MYIAEQTPDGTWRVVRPDGTILADRMTEQEASKLAFAYNITFGYLQPGEQS